MDSDKPDFILTTSILHSRPLSRDVRVDIYQPPDRGQMTPGLLIFNDGQLLPAMGLQKLLGTLYRSGRITPLVIAAVYAGPERRQEYGTAGIPDFAGRGSLADRYFVHIIQELLPVVRETCRITDFREKSFAGFSLGGLTALDIVWSHPDEFRKAGVFSGSLWWRTRDLGNGYQESTDRIMHARIRHGTFAPGLKFFFECGTEDERMDRNGIGKIDSVHDTEDLIRELEAKGYRLPEDIRYLLIPGGRHEETTWAGALPEFLAWGWGQQTRELAIDPVVSDHIST